MDPHWSWACQPPGNFAANDPSAMAAAMYAGFNAGMMAALQANHGVTKPLLCSDANLPKTAPPQMQCSRRSSVRNCDSSKPTRHAGRDHFPAQTPHQYGGTASVGDGEDNNLPTRDVSGFSQMPYFNSKLRGTTPRQSLSSCASDTSTTISNGLASLHNLRTPSPSPEPTRASCHLIWCDQRAFKGVSDSWKKQLESATCIQVKTHKTSEKCIRLLKKKQHSQTRPPCVFLVSWANAPTLLPFLSDSPNITARVILLCDTDMCRGRNRDAAERLASCYPFVAHLADSWADAVLVASRLVGEFWD